MPGEDVIIALPFTKVRDFAYPHLHPLFHGVPQQAQRDSSEAEQSRLGSAEHLVNDEAVHRVKLPPLLGSEEQDWPEPEPSTNDIYSRAIALFDFEPENDNEIALVEDQVIWVSYRHGDGWLVAQNLTTGETGLVPEMYVQFVSTDEDWEDSSDEDPNLEDLSLR